jgi:hypothetical protein
MSGSKIFAAGIAVLVLGAGPLFLYALAGSADGNPVGLGLLMAVSVPVGGIIAGLGLLKMLIGTLVRRFG